MAVQDKPEPDATTAIDRRIHRNTNDGHRPETGREILAKPASKLDGVAISPSDVTGT